MRKRQKITDYRKNRLSLSDQLISWCRGMVLAAVISYLFYHTWIAFILLLPFVFYYVGLQQKRRRQQRQKQLQRQFKEAVTLLLAALEAGYSMENAFADACRELHQMYGQETDIEREFCLIHSGLMLNETIETMVLDLAERSGIEDIRNFADVFSIVKRHGGSLPVILRASIQTIREKLEVEQEIETMLTGKKLEQRIMSVVPVAILFYVKLTSPQFLEILYKNMAGVLVMSGCLCLYMAAYYMGRRIMEVEV